LTGTLVVDCASHSPLHGETARGKKPKPDISETQQKKRESQRRGPPRKVGVLKKNKQKTTPQGGVKASQAARGVHSRKKEYRGPRMLQKEPNRVGGGAGKENKGEEKTHQIRGRELEELDGRGLKGKTGEGGLTFGRIDGRLKRCLQRKGGGAQKRDLRWKKGEATTNKRKKRQQGTNCGPSWNEKLKVEGGEDSRRKGAAEVR